MTELKSILGTDKPVVAMMHAKAMPGRPHHDTVAGMRGIREGLARDLDVLQECGVDALLFCNEQDLPYQLEVGPAVVAGMAAVIGELRPQIDIPFGVDLAWDAIAGLSVARATGAAFVRGVFTGVYDTDMGLMAPRYGDIAAYRRNIGAESVAVFAHMTPEFGESVSGRSLTSRVRGATFMGVDALLVSGLHTGLAVESDTLFEAKQAAGDTPVLVSSGVTVDTVGEILATADGVIVGTSLKDDGDTWKPMNRGRVSAFLTRVAEVRGDAGPA